MSAFLAVYNRNGSPIDLSHCSTMMDRLAHRGPDGHNCITLNNLLLSHHHLWITPEEYGEQQPLKNQSGDTVISFDGRIDNRDDLTRLIGLENRQSKKISDATIILNLYDVFGEFCFEYIIGPHSTIIYDLKKKRIIGACDRLAERGFYYYIDEKLFIAASEETSILAHPRVPKKINEKTVSYFFAMEAPRDGSTFFEGINELYPGSYLLVEPIKSKIIKYWEYKPKRIRYKNDIEYAENYRELFEESVIVRLRCSTPVSIMLSGGIDSNSIAAISAINNPHKEKVRAVSWTFDKLKECDESEIIDETCSKYGLQKIQFNGDNLWPLHEPEIYFKNPNTPIENAYRELKEYTYKLCNLNGSRLILNGWYSDYYYAGYDYWLLDLIRDIKIKRTATDLNWLLRNQGLLNIYTDPSFRKLFKFLKPLKQPLGLNKRYGWLTSYAHTHIKQIEEYENQFNNYPNLKKAMKMFDTVSFFNPCSEFYHLNKYSLELECPYRDINLIEFILNTPSYELFNRGKMKFIAKEAMKNILPRSVTDRNNSTLLTPLYNLGLTANNTKLIPNILKSSLEWSRYIDKNWIENNKYINSNQGREELVTWQCISFTSWLKNLNKNNFI